MVCPLKDGLNLKLVIRFRLMRRLRRRGSFEISVQRGGEAGREEEGREADREEEGREVR